MILKQILPFVSCHQSVAIWRTESFFLDSWSVATIRPVLPDVVLCRPRMASMEYRSRTPESFFRGMSSPSFPEICGSVVTSPSFSDMSRPDVSSVSSVAIKVARFLQMNFLWPAISSIERSTNLLRFSRLCWTFSFGDTCERLRLSIELLRALIFCSHRLHHCAAQRHRCATQHHHCATQRLLSRWSHNTSTRPSELTDGDNYAEAGSLSCDFSVMLSVHRGWVWSSSYISRRFVHIMYETKFRSYHVRNQISFISCTKPNFVHIMYETKYIMSEIQSRKFGRMKECYDGFILY